VDVWNARLADHFNILGRRECEDAVSITHRFEQRGVSAADFGCMNVAIRVLLERAVILTKHKTGEDDALVSARTRLQAVDVLLGVRRVANYQQPVGSAHLLKSFDHEMSVVLRLETGDVQDVPVWLNAPFAHELAIRAALNFGAVSNHR